MNADNFIKNIVTPESDVIFNPHFGSCSKSVGGADADIYIDGEKKAILQGRSIYGWGNVTLKNVISFDTAENHKVELKVRDTKKEFVFIEFGIS